MRNVIPAIFKTDGDRTMKHLIHKLQLEIEACNKEILKEEAGDKRIALNEGKAMGFVQAIALIREHYA